LSEENGWTLSVSKKAYDRLAWAKKEGESFSDVIIRLTSTKLEGLQRRGQKEILTSDNRILVLEIDQGKCMGAESCVALAPEVFALDASNLGLTSSSHEPLGIRDVMDNEIESDKIIRAAKSCPYKAIYVRDARNGNEQIVP
jgi:ferredoxin/predicted CopG family antitoxin